MTKQKTAGKKAGFTLIELLVVVLVIGILAAIALPQYQIAVLKSRYATLTTMIQPIKAAAERYYLSQGAYPTSWDTMDITPPTSYGESNFSTANFIYGKQYAFDLYDGSSKNIVGYVGITKADMNIAYAMWLDKSDTRAGAIECWAKPEDETANKVCLADGGIKQGVAGGSYVPAWNRYTIRAAYY